MDDQRRPLPIAVTALFGIIQLILWIAVLALEGVSIYYHPGRGTIYAGFWCSGIFFITWIATCCFLCCGKNRVCGIYLIIQHAANVVFAIILIVFTSRFIKDPCFCYGELCFIPPWEEWNTSGSSPLGGSGCTPRTWDKVPVLKGLLACAILILVTSILFILAYLIALITGRAGRRSDTHTQAITYQSQPAIVQIGAPPMQQYPYVAYPGQQQSYHGQYKSERNNYEQVTEIF